MKITLIDGPADGQVYDFDAPPYQLRVARWPERKVLSFSPDEPIDYETIKIDVYDIDYRTGLAYWRPQ